MKDGIAAVDDMMKRYVCCKRVTTIQEWLNVAFASPKELKASVISLPFSANPAKTIRLLKVKAH